MTDAEAEKAELRRWIDSQGLSARRDAILRSADDLQDLVEASEEDLREIGGERLVCCVAAHKGDEVAALLIDAGVPSTARDLRRTMSTSTRSGCWRRKTGRPWAFRWATGRKYAAPTRRGTPRYGNRHVRRRRRRPRR